MSRLLSINNYHYARGGAEVVYLEHNRLMELAGWDVGHFSMQHPKNLESPWSDHFVEELEFGQDYSLAQKLIMAPKSIYSFEARSRLRRLVDEFRPDVAHCHNVYHHLSPSVLSELKQAGVPVVLTLHDLKLLCPAYKMLNQFGVCERCKGGRRRNVIRHRCMKGSLALSALVWLESTLHDVLQTYQNSVDRFVVPSRFFASKFEEWGWNTDRFEYIPNFIDPEAFTPRFEAGDYFAYLGRFSEEKGVRTLIEGAAIAGVRVVLVGTGPLEGELRALAEQHKADVEFAGYQTGGRLAELVSGSRALVLPSEGFENAPISVLEAYAMGKPVIGADIGGIPELILPGETGDKFEAGNPHSLADELQAFAERSDAEIEALGRRGRAHVEQHYTAERYISATQALYGTLTG